MSVHVYFLLGQTEGERKTFFGRSRERYRVRLTQIALKVF